MFIQQLAYKLNDVGISVELTNEAYTSKCSFLDGESVGKHDEYCGSRIKRGLFRTKGNKLINADVNGSLNILRLGIKRDFNPKKLNDVNEICDVAYFNWQPTDRGSVLEPYTTNSCIKD